MINVNVINQYDSTKEYDQILTDIANAAYHYFDSTDALTINYILVNNNQIQLLNQQYRHIDLPTDVLSFESQDIEDELGDVFISIDKTKAQAKQYGHSFERELAFLALHGYLHCMGYDHLTKEDEIEMFKIQDDIIENSQFRRDKHYEK